MCLPSTDAVTLTGKMLPLVLFLLRESISVRVAKWLSFFAGISSGYARSCPCSCVRMQALMWGPWRHHCRDLLGDARGVK